MKRKNKKKRSPGRIKIPVIGKYVDTRTNAELKVAFFIDDIGDFKIWVWDDIQKVLKACRFQFLVGNAKSKRKFYKLLQPYLLCSSAARNETDLPSGLHLPLIFGLLKLRKGKERKLVLFQSAEQLYGGKFINVVAVIIDNLLYLELVEKHKAAALTGTGKQSIIK